jgi:hypothetical protein
MMDIAQSTLIDLHVIIDSPGVWDTRHIQKHANRTSRSIWKRVMLQATVVTLHYVTQSIRFHSPCIWRSLTAEAVHN